MTTRLIKSSENINGLPIGFQEVEYLESTGTQYIDTGFIPTGNTGIDMRFLITGRGSGGNDSNMIMSGGDSEIGRAHV